MTKVDLDALTYEEKLALVAEIGKTLPLGPVSLLGTPLSFIPVNHDGISPGTAVTLDVRCYAPFKIHRLVILEQTTGEEEEETEKLTAPKRLGDASKVIEAPKPLPRPCSDCGAYGRQHKRYCQAQWEQVKVSVEERQRQIIAERAAARGYSPAPVVAETRIVHTIPRHIPRSAWEVGGMFVGTRSIFHPGWLSGDAFGPYGTMDFDAPTCQVGLPITLQVRHNLKVSVPFRAVLLGRSAEQ